MRSSSGAGSKAVARNAARDGGRKRGRYYAMLEKFSLWRREEPVIGEVTEKRLKPALEELLSELSPSDRRLIEAKYLDDESMRDLAAQSGLTEKAVESRLLRLRRKLRERLLKKLNEP